MKPNIADFLKIIYKNILLYSFIVYTVTPRQ